MSRSNETAEHVLCVKETLASGRSVVFAFDPDGRPSMCWDSVDLPPEWLDASSWLRAGVAIGRLRSNEKDSLPVLEPATPARCGIWLARMYRYMTPLQGMKSCLRSSALLFVDEVVAQCAERASVDSHVLEVGGIEMARRIHATTECAATAVDPTFAITDDAEELRLHTTCGLAERLPLEDVSVDCVVSMFTLEHLVDPVCAVTEMMRVLRPGGKMLLGIPVDERPNGAPPLFHRWRFVDTDGDSHASRTMNVSELLSPAYVPNSSHEPGFSVIARKGEARLFAIEKGGGMCLKQSKWQ